MIIFNKSVSCGVEIVYLVYQFDAIVWFCTALEQGPRDAFDQTRSLWQNRSTALQPLWNIKLRQHKKVK